VSNSSRSGNKTALRRLESALRRYALAYPEAAEDNPWGDRVVKVRGKIFAFIDQFDGALHVTVKLPRSAPAALALPFAKPTGYGLGKAGWVSLQIVGTKALPTDVLRDWIDESYRAVAPKRLVATLSDDA
jgi:predicted DNA-binding protein (MmcQ/YjbR family)